MKSKFAKRIDTSKAYVPAVSTDIRETFKRIRREQEETAKKVTPIKQRKVA